ncbi:glycosyltransferase family 2 protein [Ornithinimicrobium sp. INDO-MA30-4]|uniref:glycosyltransferase family 2 protein n=1 Tax=Ornithinimicrobium sp. INDO-MA30-4 TaxID=2908651 RepID=UPI001F3F427E|nr:glycosyltransferase family A protein [Ornithinimicrobium sp. INDO-MA30-4]UJH69911.1 glycosyltransferase [Ornithinimicrobium sp. INDO-MA30-4]
MTLPISVIITAHNAAGVITKQLAALDAQVAQANGEIVVADNKSTDDTASVVTAWAQQSQAAVRVIPASGRMGISHGRNQGALASLGEALAFVDADDEVQPGWIESALLGLETHHLVKGKTWWPGPNGELRGRLVNARGQLSGGNFAIKREVFFAIGGFDESLPRYGGEDTLLTLRAKQEGVRMTTGTGMHLAFNPTRTTLRLLPKLMRSGMAETVIWSRHPGYFNKPLNGRTVALDIAVLPPYFLTQMVNKKGVSARSLVRTSVTTVGHFTATSG